MDKKLKRPEIPLNILSIITVVLAALLLVLIFRLKIGPVGVALGAILVVALIYWLKEISRIVSREEAHPEDEAEWFYDLIENGETIILTAKVPGPPKDVEVGLGEGVLEIKGGGEFMQKINVTKNAEITDRSYINGVLRVRLQKMKKPRDLKESLKEWTQSE